MKVWRSSNLIEDLVLGFVELLLISDLIVH